MPSARATATSPSSLRTSTRRPPRTSRLPGAHSRPSSWTRSSTRRPPALRKEIVDARRSRTGQFLLTGSQNLECRPRSRSPWPAGRGAAPAPASWREIARDPDRPLPWDRSGRSPRRLAAARVRCRGQPSCVARIRSLPPTRGATPICGTRATSRTYLRARRPIAAPGGRPRRVPALPACRRGPKRAAPRPLGHRRELGVAVNTAKAWLSVLQATYQVFLLRPYHANVGKRLVKTPRVYMADVGLLCYLTGIRTARQAREGPWPARSSRRRSSPRWSGRSPTRPRAARPLLADLGRLGGGPPRRGGARTPRADRGQGLGDPPASHAAAIAAFRRDLGARADRAS